MNKTPSPQHRLVKAFFKAYGGLLDFSGRFAPPPRLFYQEALAKDFGMSGHDLTRALLAAEKRFSMPTYGNQNSLKP